MEKSLFIRDYLGENGKNWERDAESQFQFVCSLLQSHVIYIDTQGVLLWQMSNKIVFPEIVDIIEVIGKSYHEIRDKNINFSKIRALSKRNVFANKSQYSQKFIQNILSKEDFWKRDSIRQVFKIVNSYITGELYIDSHGIARWKSNNNVIPRECYDYLAYSNICPRMYFVKNDKERDKETREVIATYKKQQQNYKPSAEEIAEMESAFGKGTAVVDVITGKRIL